MKVLDEDTRAAEALTRLADYISQSASVGNWGLGKYPTADEQLAAANRSRHYANMIRALAAETIHRTVERSELRSIVDEAREEGNFGMPPALLSAAYAALGSIRW